MKRKTISLLLALTIATFGMTACGNNSEQEISSEQTESVTETEQVETEQVETEQVSETTDDNTTADSTTKEISKVQESKSWPDYKKTAEYYIESGKATEAAMHVLNPDIYGTETAGKSTDEVDFDLMDASTDTRRLKVATTKGYPIEAWYYAEVGTVQFIYTGEMNPGGGWYTDMDSIDVLDAYFNYEKSLLDITHEEKIQILGEPTMTAEEVIAALQ